MFTDKKLWRTDFIVQGLSKIPISQAHSIVWMAALGGIMAIIGFFELVPYWKEHPDAMPEPLELIFIGLAYFMFSPMAYIIYLAKELQQVKSRLQELEKKILAGVKPEDGPEFPQSGSSPSV